MKLWNFPFKVHVHRSVAWFLSAPFLLSSSAPAVTQGILCHLRLTTPVSFSTSLAAGTSQNLLPPTNLPEELSPSSFTCCRDASRWPAKRGLMLALPLAPFSPWTANPEQSHLLCLWEGFPRKSMGVRVVFNIYFFFNFGFKECFSSRPSEK